MASLHAACALHGHTKRTLSLLCRLFKLDALFVCSLRINISFYATMHSSFGLKLTKTWKRTSEFRILKRLAEPNFPPTPHWVPNLLICEKKLTLNWLTECSPRRNDCVGLSSIDRSSCSRVPTFKMFRAQKLNGLSGVDPQRSSNWPHFFPLLHSL